MSWNYRVCRYTTEGVELFSILEVYYNDAGEPDGYCAASMAEWETFEDLSGTVTMLHTALAKPILDVSAEIGKLGGEGIDCSDIPRSTTEQLATLRRIGARKIHTAAPRDGVRIQTVEGLPGYRLRLGLSDGRVVERDLSHLLPGPDASPHNVFRPWLDPAYFAQVSLPTDPWPAPTWPNGVDLDPDALIRGVDADGNADVEV